LNLILPDDNKGKKISKNLVLLKAINHIIKLREELGDTPVEGIDLTDDDQTMDESLYRKAKRRKRIAACKPNTHEKDDARPPSPIKV
jgi:hypothetical protein